MSSKAGYKITDDDRRQVSGGRLVAELGMDREEIEWRKKFTRFNEADAELLSASEEVFEELSTDLVETFYDHLQSFDASVAIIDSSTKGVDALKQSQVEYLRDLGRGGYDEGYFERRARIGKLHDMLDLGPKLYLGAYTIYYEGIINAFAEELREEIGADTGQEQEDAVDRFVDRTLASLKLLNLDQQVAMDTYIHSYSRTMEAELERRERVSADVQSAVAELKRASENVAESSQEISAIATEQSDALGSVATEVSDLSATVQEIASTAEGVERTSDEAETLAENGRSSATEAIEAMGEVSEAADDVVGTVDSLKDRVETIDSIVEVINTISEQTNLLALNASIEAARAGEAGEGFAVVADEVKSLAEESQTQAGNIEEMIDRIQAETEETVEGLTEASRRIDRGIDRVQEAMENLSNIVEAVKETSAGIQEVAGATDDQARSTESVAQLVDETVEQMERIAEEIEGIAAANQEQAAKVIEVNEAVQELTET